MNKIDETLKEYLLSLVPNKLFSQLLDKILKSCFINLIEDQNNLKIIETIKKSLTDIKQQEYLNELFNCLMLLIIEFQRKNYLEAEIQYTLKELGFDTSQIDIFTSKYNQFIDFISNKDNENIMNKFDSSINIKKLIDVEWRNEYIVSSKFLNKINKDVFNINLKVLNEKNEVEPITFKCELEELTDLVHTLNVACKCIENASDLKHLNLK